jgi:hypothetical protein
MELRFPLVDLSHSSPRSEEDARFLYAVCNINFLSAWLHIHWSLQKKPWDKPIVLHLCTSSIYMLKTWEIAPRSNLEPLDKHTVTWSGGHPLSLANTSNKGS